MKRKIFLQNACKLRIICKKIFCKVKFRTPYLVLDDLNFQLGCTG